MALALHQLHLLPMRKWILVENPRVESENLARSLILGVFNS